MQLVHLEVEVEAEVEVEMQLVHLEAEVEMQLNQQLILVLGLMVATVKADAKHEENWNKKIEKNNFIKY